MRKVRVLHISKYYHPFVGGTELVARQCVRALQGSVFEQAVICFDHKGMKGASAGEKSEDSVDLVDGVRVVRCACEAKIASQSLSFSYRRRLQAVFDQFRPDIVVLHYPNPFAAHYLLSFLKPEQKLVIFWHLDIVKQKHLGKFFNAQNERLLERADRLIAASPNYVEGSPWLRKYREKCVIIPDCIDDENEDVRGKTAASAGVITAGESPVGKTGSVGVQDTEHTVNGTKPDETAQIEFFLRKRFAGKILCLAVGRHVEYKGFRYLIEAAKYLDERFVIIIAGAGPLTEELKRQAENLPELKSEASGRKTRTSEPQDQKKAGADEEIKPDSSKKSADSGYPQIIFAGLVPDGELRAYLHACDIFCFPSITKNEAFGIALAEAMYCGKPAVTFTIEGSGVNFVSLGGVTGIECPNRDSRAYAEALLLLADRPDLRNQYGEAARKRVEEHFLYRQFAGNIRQLFRVLVSKKTDHTADAAGSSG